MTYLKKKLKISKSRTLSDILHRTRAMTYENPEKKRQAFCVHRFINKEEVLLNELDT